jgi:hypothetical protein
MRKGKEEYLTPGEVLQEYPFLMDDYNWSIQTPGVLLAIGVLHGKYIRGKHMTLITRSSVLKLLCFYQVWNDERNAHISLTKPI